MPTELTCASENRTLVASHAQRQGSPCGFPSKQTDRDPQGALLALRYETFPLHSSGTLQGQGTVASENSQQGLEEETRQRAGRETPGNTVVSDLPRDEIS
jgi:hypothetical protein